MPRRALAAKRYAEAIAGIARAAGTWQRWRRDLQAARAAHGDSALRASLESPRVPFEQKRQLLRTALGDRVAPETLNLLGVLAQRGRFELLPDVIAWFEELADRALGVRRFTVTSAAPLTEEQRRRLRQRLGGPQGPAPPVAGGEVVLAERVDPEILGGLVIQQDDIIRDFSVRARLESLRERLN
jgi:ATP synthase F1 delta subunit